MKTRTLSLSIGAALLSFACGGSAPPPQQASATPASSALGPDPLAKTAAHDPYMPKPPKHPDSSMVTWKENNPPKRCHPPSAPSGDLVAALGSMVANCIDTKQLHMVGQTTRGEGKEGDSRREPMVTKIPLKAQANHCYRVFGIGEPSVKDFDIAVMDSTGKSAGEDETDSFDAIVLEDGMICFKQDDNVSVNAAVARGAGKWAVQIWSD